MNNIKNIIWDWNGTIVNDAYLFVDIMNITLTKYKLQNITLNDYKTKFCFPIKTYWKNLGFNFNDATFNIMNHEFIKLYQNQMKEPLLHNQITDVLNYAKNNSINQFILSASEHSMLNQLAQYYKINNYFKDIVGVDNLNACGKEKLGISLVEKYNIDVNKTILIGDSEYDSIVAKSIGCKAILVSFGHIDGKRLKKTGDMIIDNYNDLITLFKNNEIH